MATRTFAVERDARVGYGGGLNLGAGACDHLPVGESGGYEYRSFIKFDNSWADMTDVSQVRLYLTNDDDSLSDDHLVRGSTSGARKFYVDRVTEGWSAGTSSHPMTTSNGSISSGGNMVYPGPTCSTTGNNRVGPFTATDTDNDQQYWDVTDLFKYMIPTTVYVSGASTPGYGIGNTNYGIRLIREDASDMVEFWSSEKGGSTKVPKIVVYYTTNTLPTITIDSPSDGTVVTGGTTYATPSVTIGATATDADGDAITNVQFEFDTTADFATPYLTSTADDDVAGVVSRAVSSATHPRGTEIFVRARASDATGYGSWSTTVSFTINNATAPTITSSGAVADSMEMTVEGADTGPRAVVRFTYADPEGQSMSRYTAGLYSDSGGTALLGTLVDVSTTTPPTYVKSDYTGLVHGTTYYWFVQTYDADGLSTGRVSMQRKARWAVREEYVALTTATWVTSTVKTEATNTRAVIQHGIQTAGAAGTNPTNYNTDPAALSSLTPTYYWAKYWLFAWHGAATSGVQITSHTLTYTSSSLTADGWTLGTGASITTARSWYGTRCLRIDGTGAGGTTRSASVSVTGFKVGETYTISCRVFQSGAASGFLRLMNGSTSIRSAGLVDVGVADASTSEFVYTWDTIEDCPAETLTVQCDMTGAAGTYVLFDAVKVEQGPIATPWTPSVLGRAVVVDGNGVQVDGRGGGVVRFRGTDTTSSDAEVDLIDRGLRFSSPLTLKEVSAPSSPASGYRRLYLKSDGLLYLKDSGGTETAVGGGATPALSAVLAVGADANHVAVSNLLLAAGSATAGSWPKMTAGTLQTTPDDGSIEMDGDVFYMTTDAGNRGVVSVEHIIRADSTRTFTSNTSDQVIFTTPANGRLTLETGCYLIEGMLAFTSMSATSGNLVFKLKGGGSATLAAIMVNTFGADIGAASIAGAMGMQWNTTGNSTTNAITAAGNASLLLRVYGTFEVSAGGTIQPSIALTTAAAAVLSIGSHLRVRRIGSQSMTSVGDWD